MMRQHPHERGQVSALAALVLAMILVMAIGIAAIGTVLVERQSAMIAADASALASAAGAPDDLVAGWYRARDVDVVVTDGRSEAAVGSATARSVAAADDQLVVAPAVVAILARAEQLLGHELVPLELTGVEVVFADRTSTRFAGIAGELGMCEVPEPSENRRFALC